MATPHADIAIRAAGLNKHYGEVTALDGLDLEVPKGRCWGCSGPTVRARRRRPHPDHPAQADAGRPRWPASTSCATRERCASIGVSGQYAAVDEHLTGLENLDMVGRLYHLGRASRTGRGSCSSVRPQRGRRPPGKTYSGGMRRRLDLAGALIAEPQVLFLDEPTTGLDPRGRADMWDVIGSSSAGTTLLLTTQYLEEADRLADRIVVIDHGRVIAAGPPTS